MSDFYAVLVYKTRHADYIVLSSPIGAKKPGGLRAGRFDLPQSTYDAMPEEYRRPHWLFLVGDFHPGTRAAWKRRFRPALCPVWAEDWVTAEGKAGSMPDELFIAGANRTPDRPDWNMAWRGWLTALEFMYKRHGRQNPELNAVTVYSHLLGDDE